MSEMEYHKGQLVTVDLKGKTIEEFFEQLCFDANYVSLKKECCYDYDSFEELYCEEIGRYYEYVEHNGVFYKADDTDLDDGGFIESTLENDDSITYFVGFYNGGAGLGEVLKDAIDNAK